MKRLRLILLLGLVAVFLFVACRGEESKEPAPSPTTTATPTPVAGRGEDASEEAATPASVAMAATEAMDTTGGEGIVYTIPFEVQPDGFGFRNYGPGYPEGDFTINELRELFGDGVCSRVDDESEVCVPSAEAQQWIDDRNADMRAGHCIGFTVTSYRFAEGELQPELFYRPADAPFEIPQEAAIMRTIALNGSLYWVKSVWSSEVSGTPREIIDALITMREPADLSIFLPGLVGGHSLLAYGVEEVAPQQYRILVYDNNFPGEEAFVEVDYEANTWRYAQGAVNPDQTAIPYEGDATTETLRFIPLSAYETATCPFCPSGVEEGVEEEENDEAFTLISFLGQGEMLVKTALGAIGSVAGEIVNEIPGARLIFLRGQLAANGPPHVALPAGTDFTVEFNGLKRLSSMSANLSLVLDHLTPAHQDNQLSVTPDGQNVEFQAGGEQSPSLSVTIRQADASYQVTLLGLDFSDGQGLSIGVAKSGDGLELRSQEIDISDATLLLTRLTDEEEAVFATTALDIKDDGGVTLDIAKWDGSGSINLFEDGDGDGSYDERPTELKNEPLDDVLQGSELDQVSNIIDAFSPFLGERGLEAILASLAEGDLSGQAIGQILQPLQLTNEQLITIIPPLSLPIPELGELLFVLRLEPERVEAVSTGLDLAAEDKTELTIYLDDLALYHEIMSDWAFLNTNDLSQLIALLNEANLTTEQLVRLLPRMGLSAAEIEQVLGGLTLPLTELVDVVEQLGVDMPATQTPTPTSTAAQTVTVPVTAGTPISGTRTLTPSATISVTMTIEAGGTPAGTATPNPYPGALPIPSSTPGAYPYPGPGPSPTGSPDPYPGNIPPTTPEFQSSVFCIGDDLRVVAEESTWKEETAIEIWADEELLFSGEIGSDGDPLEVTLPGPGTWTNLYIEASVEPIRVPFRTITCPIEE